MTSHNQEQPGRWSEAEDALLITARRQKMSWQRTAQKVGRTLQACQARWRNAMAGALDGQPHSERQGKSWPITHTFWGRDIADNSAAWPVRLMPPPTETGKGRASL